TTVPGSRNSRPRPGCNSPRRCTQPGPPRAARDDWRAARASRCVFASRATADQPGCRSQANGGAGRIAAPGGWWCRIRQPKRRNIHPGACRADAGSNSDVIRVGSTGRRSWPRSGRGHKAPEAAGQRLPIGLSSHPMAVPPFRGDEGRPGRSSRRGSRAGLSRRGGPGHRGVEAERGVEAGRRKGGRAPQGRPGAAREAGRPERRGRPRAVSAALEPRNHQPHRTRPGFRMPRGSRAVLIARITRTASGPRWISSQSRRATPIPCSPVTVPPSSRAAR
ncbi:MAG: hypothetical protein QOJ75_2476, partial [Chloroflexota bacterium]|nr:hypothetical protein [Chloroflexota bacterium]